MTAWRRVVQCMHVTVVHPGEAGVVNFYYIPVRSTRITGLMNVGVIICFNMEIPNIAGDFCAAFATVDCGCVCAGSVAILDTEVAGGVNADIIYTEFNVHSTPLCNPVKSIDNSIMYCYQ